MRKNLKKIPPSVEAKLDTIDGDNIVAAVLVKAKQVDIEADVYSALGLTVENGVLKITGAFRADANTGKYSKINAQGRTVTRKDLPKRPKTFDLGERPYFGDWSKGSFTLYATRDVYQKQFLGPNDKTISVSLLSESDSASGKVFNIKVVVDEVLDKASPTFRTDLLFNLNLLQELVHRHDVFSADATSADYLRTLVLDWEIFPPGEREDDLQRIMGSYRNVTPELIDQVQQRYDVIMSTNPEQILIGLSGIRRYFGAWYSDNLVAFENLDYGNAIYVLYENWQMLSQLSRVELLNRLEQDYERIEHRSGWNVKFKELIDKKRPPAPPAATTPVTV